MRALSDRRPRREGKVKRLPGGFVASRSLAGRNWDCRIAPPPMSVAWISATGRLLGHRRTGTLALAGAAAVAAYVLISYMCRDSRGSRKSRESRLATVALTLWGRLLSATGASSESQRANGVTRRA